MPTNWKSILQIRTAFPYLKGIHTIHKFAQIRIKRTQHVSHRHPILCRSAFGQRGTNLVALITFYICHRRDPFEARAFVRNGRHSNDATLYSPASDNGRLVIVAGIFMNSEHDHEDDEGGRKKRRKKGKEEEEERKKSDKKRVSDDSVVVCAIMTRGAFVRVMMEEKIEGEILAFGEKIVVMEREAIDRYGDPIYPRQRYDTWNTS